MKRCIVFVASFFAALFASAQNDQWVEWGAVYEESGVGSIDVSYKIADCNISLDDDGFKIVNNFNEPILVRVIFKGSECKTNKLKEKKIYSGRLEAGETSRVCSIKCVKQPILTHEKQKQRDAI